MGHRGQINHEDYHQLRFVFTHVEFGEVEVFATSPKNVYSPTVSDIVIQSAGIVGDLHADAEDISELDLALMKQEAFRFLSTQEDKHD